MVLESCQHLWCGGGEKRLAVSFHLSLTGKCLTNMNSYGVAISQAEGIERKKSATNRRKSKGVLK